MSLNKIQLPSYVVAECYKTVLVELENSTNSVATSLKLEIPKSLGENKKQITILVNCPDAVFLTDNQLNFLTQLLAACKLNLGDVSILNFYNLKMDYEQIVLHFNCRFILQFDVAPSDLEMPILFPHFLVQAHKETSYLYLPSLPEIEADKALKVKTWNCLKNIFNL